MRPVSATASTSRSLFTIMATEVNAFSHLESLLLFQSVVAHGNTAEAFARISKSLRNSPLLQRQPDANVDRLNPDALTGLYLRLLKSEAKRALSDSSTAASASSSTHPPPNTESPDPSSSRTNGIPSPRLSTIEDATPHRHLEPLMIDKLYALYQDQVTREIKEDENQYDRLIQEVKKLESSSTSASINVAQDKTIDASELTKGTKATDASLQANAGSGLSKDSTPQKPKQTDSRQLHALPGVHHNKKELGKPSSNTISDDATAVKNVRNSSPQQPGSNDKSKDSTPQPAMTTPAIKNSSEKSARLPGSHVPSTSQPSDPNTLNVPPPSHASVGTTPSQSSLSKRSGGMQLPPFQVFPQAPMNSSKASSTDSRNAAQDNKVPSPGNQTPSSIKSHTKAPIPNLLQEGQGVHYSPGSSTGWKVTPGMPDAATPRPRSISPLSERDSSPERASKRRRTTRGATNADSTKPKSSAKATSQTPSMAATSSRGRTRSPSGGSPVEETAQQPSTIKRPKTEVSTPAANLNPPPTTRSSRTTRNTPAVAPSPSSPQTATASRPPAKRKRASTNETDASAPQSPVPFDTKPIIKPEHEPESEPPNTIRASRNFHKASAPILNNIGSHKHASLFSQPVSSRTKGYYDIIKRPTDLNTIRKAIAAGVKAVNAAISSGVSGNAPQAGSPTTAAAAISASDATGQPPTPGGDSAHTVLLPLSRELVPPEGIVNGAQLEQEIMRMFANAVMFNEGDDGVVADTQEMFNEVEAHFAAWKEAQSSNE